MIGRESEIRTHGRDYPSTAFKAVALNRSATSPNYLSLIVLLAARNEPLTSSNLDKFTALSPGAQP